MKFRGITLIIVAAFLLLLYTTKTDWTTLQKSKVSPAAELNLVMNLVIILCGDDSMRKQAAVLLKSAVIFSKTKLHFHIVTDKPDFYSSLKNMTAGWPNQFRDKLRLSRHEIPEYPEGFESMRDNFKSCASTCLFIPDMFPQLDKAIYIDTDTIFLRPVDDLWSQFDQFNSTQLLGVTSENEFYYVKSRTGILYYGALGVNTGVILMDLHRMRGMEGGWLETNLDVYKKYTEQIWLADQDIINILFHFQPEKLYEMGCQWNYRQFTEVDCLPAIEEGVSILHGNRVTFLRGVEMKFQVIFEGVESHDLTNSTPLQLFNKLKQSLIQVDKENMPSIVRQIPDIDKILLGQLKNHIPGAVLD